MKKIALLLSVIIAIACSSCLNNNGGNNSIEFTILQLNYNHNSASDLPYYLTKGEYTYAINYDNNTIALTFKTLIEPGSPNITTFTVPAMNMTAYESGYQFSGGTASAEGYTITNIRGVVYGTNLVSVSYDINSTTTVTSCCFNLLYAYGDVNYTNLSGTDPVRYDAQVVVVPDLNSSLASVYLFNVGLPGGATQGEKYAAISVDDVPMTVDGSGIHLTMPKDKETVPLYSYTSAQQVSKEYAIKLSDEYAVSNLKIDISPNNKWALTNGFTSHSTIITFNARMFY